MSIQSPSACRTWFNRHGATIDEMCRSFPGVTRAQVYACLFYYEDHRVEIDALVAEKMNEKLA